MWSWMATQGLRQADKAHAEGAVLDDLLDGIVYARTRVMGNHYDPSREVTCGRGKPSAGVARRVKFRPVSSDLSSISLRI